MTHPAIQALWAGTAVGFILMLSPCVIQHVTLRSSEKSLTSPSPLLIASMTPIGYDEALVGSPDGAYTLTHMNINDRSCVITVSPHPLKPPFPLKLDRFGISAFLVDYTQTPQNIREVTAKTHAIVSNNQLSFLYFYNLYWDKQTVGHIEGCTLINAPSCPLNGQPIKHLTVIRGAIMIATDHRLCYGLPRDERQKASTLDVVWTDVFFRHNDQSEASIGIKTICVGWAGEAFYAPTEERRPYCAILADDGTIFGLKLSLTDNAPVTARQLSLSSTIVINSICPNHRNKLSNEGFLLLSNKGEVYSLLGNVGFNERSRIEEYNLTRLAFPGIPLASTIQQIVSIHPFSLLWTREEQSNKAIDRLYAWDQIEQPDTNWQVSALTPVSLPSGHTRISVIQANTATHNIHIHSLGRVFCLEGTSTCGDPFTYSLALYEGILSTDVPYWYPQYEDIPNNSNNEEKQTSRGAITFVSMLLPGLHPSIAGGVDDMRCDVLSFFPGPLEEPTTT